MAKKLHAQNTPYDSPWSKSQRIKMVLWEYVWLIFCSWTPKPANFWRLFWLKAFGAKISGRPFVHQRARIQIPWNLIMHHRACLGDRANAYTLGVIEIHEHATVAQEAYLCTGTHDFTQPARNLVTSPIIIGAYSFISARAFIMPGVTIGEYAIVGACSVVTKNVLPNTTVKGNPAK
ncbi:putative colanic acid biosynthesis acetyltransferase WcaF [Mucilaginibacter frigoritolerans]|uniref:Putative colanic acid biosynthesis acetyltransferase WcaF n=1 Tax=Mucilaginibacter frigoritolerans TaxID=652788 RepID=A0A562U4T9_9SPHI|nr:putative colanic acid biosynthesis acetyltransferase [Mucilaginibacter frigoritolerans]TWJ00788.1 putative colanic acid biosynthesis acetyltransferase WcaF [Mucilaginibacter frigoritolerans]